MFEEASPECEARRAAQPAISALEAEQRVSSAAREWPQDPCELLGPEVGQLVLAVAQQAGAHYSAVTMQLLALVGGVAGPAASVQARPAATPPPAWPGGIGSDPRLAQLGLISHDCLL